MALQQTVTVQDELVLSPKLAKQLDLECQVYLRLKKQQKALEAQIDESKAKLGAIRDDVGVESLERNGFKVTLVAGTHAKFNEKKFIALGGNLAIYKEAVEIKPSQPYEKITIPTT